MIRDKEINCYNLLYIFTGLANLIKKNLNIASVASVALVKFNVHEKWVC